MSSVAPQPVKKKQRARVMEFFIDVARECFNIGNFNSLMAIICERCSFYTHTRTQTHTNTHTQRLMSESDVFLLCGSKATQAGNLLIAVAKRRATK